MSDSYNWKPTPQDKTKFENSSTFERGSYSHDISTLVTENAFDIAKLMEVLEKKRVSILEKTHEGMPFPEKVAIAINDAINSWVRAVCIYSCDRVSYDGMREIAERLCIAVPEAMEDTIRMIEARRKDK